MTREEFIEQKRQTIEKIFERQIAILDEIKNISETPHAETLAEAIIKANKMSELAMEGHSLSIQIEIIKAQAFPKPGVAILAESGNETIVAHGKEYSKKLEE